MPRFSLSLSLELFINLNMTTRREFFRKGGAALAAMAVANHPVFAGVHAKETYVSNRPELAKRRFTSKAVEKLIASTKKKIKDPKLAWMFENCFPNTLDTTVDFKMEEGKPDTFVITGDINAMWLRDSGAQVWPYVQLCKEDEQLRLLVAGVINRQTRCIIYDPYANSFSPTAESKEWKDDITDMKPWIHERKWEIDSLCYPVRLAFNYWKNTGDTSVFSKDWEKAMYLVHQTFREQQRKEKSPYKFQRKTERQLDTVCCDGYGNPVNPVGLIVSSFRPSDDATTYGFLVPSNMFAVKSLRQIAEIADEVLKNSDLSGKCRALANEVAAAIEKYCIVEHPKCGKIYAFEVDGFGNAYFMDDANIPSLLAMPYLDTIDVKDPIYQNTRKFVWSSDNPYFFKGAAGEGIGGPHIGYDYVWPMSIIMKAMTGQSDEEIKSCIKMLRDTDGETGFMHESFLKSDAKKFTRSWFAWANTLFGELIVKLVQEGKSDLLNNL